MVLLSSEPSSSFKEIEKTLFSDLPAPPFSSADEYENRVLHWEKAELALSARRKKNGNTSLLIILTINYLIALQFNKNETKIVGNKKLI